MEAVTDLQIKQLAECFLVAGNPFLNRKEHADNDHMKSSTSDPDILTNIDEESVQWVTFCMQFGNNY